MKLPEKENFVELKTHLRYLNEKIIEAFSRFLTYTTAIVAGVFYIHIVLNINDPRRTSLGIPASTILSILGLGTIVLIITNLNSWHEYRKTLAEYFPIHYKAKLNTFIGEIFMCLIIVFICVLFWFVNPL